MVSRLLKKTGFIRITQRFIKQSNQVKSLKVLADIKSRIPPYTEKRKTSTHIHTRESNGFLPIQRDHHATTPCNQDTKTPRHLENR